MNLAQWQQRLPNRSMLLKVVNYLFFNFLWPACIFGAAAQVWWPGALLLAAFFLWHWLSGSTVRGDWKLVLIIVPWASSSTRCGFDWGCSALPRRGPARILRRCGLWCSGPVWPWR